MKNSIKRVQSESSLSALLSARILRKAKLRLTLLAAIPLLMGLTSCQQEEDFAALEQEIRLNITAGGVQTRVNPLGTGDLWESGDNLVVAICGEAIVSHKLTANVTDNQTIWTSDKKIYWSEDSDYEIYAAYPYKEDPTHFSLPSEQNTLDGLRAADFMSTYWSGQKTNEVINLPLAHRLSRVTVNYVLAPEFDSDMEITPEIYSKAKAFTFVRGVLATSVGKLDVWVKAYKHEELDAYENVVAKKFTAIVSPDAYSAGDDFIRIYVEGEQLIAKMKEDITFAEGTHYTFDLKVGKDKVSVEQVSMGDFDSPFGDGWNNEEDLN